MEDASIDVTERPWKLLSSVNNGHPGLWIKRNDGFYYYGIMYNKYEYENGKTRMRVFKADSPSYIVSTDLKFEGPILNSVL